MNWLTHVELGNQFDLIAALNWGTIPKAVNTPDDITRTEFLRTYTRTYLKEEVWDERLIHNLDPFRKFLEVEAQSNGTIMVVQSTNFSNYDPQLCSVQMSINLIGTCRFLKY